MRRQSAERGSVLLEFAIVAAGAFLGTLLFFDVGTLLLGHLTLTQIVAEGVNTAARIPDLEEGTYVDQDTITSIVTNCSNASAATSDPCGHLFVQQRIRFLLDNTNLLVETPSITISTRYTELSGVAGAPNDTVVVTLTVVHSGFLLPPLTINVTAEAAYLY